MLVFDDAVPAQVIIGTTPGFFPDSESLRSTAIQN
jgi:hypothetical protein